MSTKTVNGPEYLKMLRAGAVGLEAKRTEVNDLNVFPIPDGDTGDNMFMTLRSGCDSVNSAEGLTLGEVSSLISRGMLLGARGNSGVILSRIFAGISKELAEVSEAGLDLWKRAMLQGVCESYKAVAVPVEGTILTVFKDAVRVAGTYPGNDIDGYMESLCGEMAASLERTPDLLQVLKEAGVVDSGGAGLVHIFEGMRDAVCGRTSDTGLPSSAPDTGHIDLDAFSEDSVLEFGYCTEFLLRLQTAKVGVVASFDESVIKDYLASAGESLVFIRDGSIIKVHVHTRTPGEILGACQKWGEFLKVKVENMTLQHHENNMDRKVARGPRKKRAVIAVASGEGLVSIFKENGADFVIEGGQTMNPSAESFLEAFDRVNADLIYVLPNNSNIILTARQAAGLYKGSEVRVIGTRNIGAGYVVLGSVDFAHDEADELCAQAEQVASSTVAAMVCRSIRDTKDTVKGDFVGFSNGKIMCDAPDRTDAFVSLCGKLDAGSYDVLAVFKGADVPMEEAEALSARLGALYPRLEVAVCDGGQPVYDYIIVLQ